MPPTSRSRISLIHLLEQVERLKLQSKRLQNSKTSFIVWIKKQWRKGVLKIFVIWLIWMLVGTIFYAIYDFNNSFAKGFYYAVNVGYSIGDGVLTEKNDRSKIFSVFYLLTGALILSSLLATYIESFVNKKNEGYDDNFRAYVRQQSSLYGSWSPVIEFFMLNAPKLAHVFYWLIYVLFGTIWSYYVVGWSFIDGLYFATSTLSTGGLNGIPSDSPDWVFFTEAMFACTGIPVMGMAIGDLASLIIEYNRKIRFDNLTNQSFGRGNSFFMDMQSLDTSNQQLKQHQNSQQNSQQNNNHYSPPQEIPELDDNIYDHNNIDGPQVVISPLHTNITNLTYSILTHSEESTDTTTKDIQLPISQRSPLEYTTFDTDNSNKVNDILLNTTNTATNTATNTDTIINENADIIRSIRPATIINENADITRSIRPATVGINNSNSDRSQSSRQTDQINTSTLTQSEFVIIELVRLNVVSKSMVKAMIDKYNNQR